MAHTRHPTEQNKKLLQEAVDVHEHYRDMCLSADEMIGLEGIL